MDALIVVEKFTIDISEEALARVYRRVEDCRFPPEPAGSEWELGIPISFMAMVQRHFLNTYDWRAAERELNALPHCRTKISGTQLHFIHRRSDRPDAVPLLLLHGWPGSIMEFVDHIDPLAIGLGAAKGDPTFHVVVPSLPGFGFSDAPPSPVTPREIAATLHRLMTVELGYRQYAVHGGDWGSMIAGWLAFDHPDACVAVHWTMVGLLPGGDAPGFTAAGIAPPETGEEIAWAQRCSAASQDFGYAAIQSTKPQSLGFAMSDSPLGAMAWILEKFHGWTDRRGCALETLIDLDRLITNTMLYVLTDKFVSASWMYRSLITEGNALPAGKRIEVPVALAAVAYDVMPAPPRSYVEKGVNLVRYTAIERGGHFLSLEQPDVWIDDVRQFLASQLHLFENIQEKVQ